MDRDPSVGTALQEITFWLNLERALLNIQEMRDSAEVQLTLDILKHGKRFHATVSFDTDTGLKQALTKEQIDKVTIRWRHKLPKVCVHMICWETNQSFELK